LTQLGHSASAARDAPRTSPAQLSLSLFWRFQTWVSAVLSRITIQGAEAVEGGVVAANSTVSPVRNVSGGLSITRSCGVTPAVISNAVTDPAKLNGLEHHFVAGSKNFDC
jgi:hypothetical protein